VHRLVRWAVFVAALAAALAAATAACSEQMPLVSPDGRWHAFTDQTHGVSLRIQEPFRGAEVGDERGVWTAHIYVSGASRDPRGGVNGLTITATPMSAKERIEADRLIDIAPAMTAEIIAAERRAGAGDIVIEQPLQPLVVSRYRGLEMLYQRRDPQTGALLKSDVLVVVNDGWLLRFTITGDEAFWESGGPAARRFVETLSLSEPRPR